MMSIDLHDMDQLVSTPDEGFEQIFSAMKHALKEQARQLLIYADKALNFLLIQPPKGPVKGSHLHLPMIFDQQKDIILEYIIIKLFYRSLQEDDVKSDYIPSKLNSLSKRLERMTAPGSASGIKNNTAFKEYQEERRTLLSKQRFLQQIDDPSKGFVPRFIINGQHNDLDLIEQSPYITELESLPSWKAYVLLNEHKFKDLLGQLLAQDIAQGLKGVVLFDYAGRNTFRGCDLNSLESYYDSDITIKDLIVITFGSEVFRLKQQIDRCVSVYRKYLCLPQHEVNPAESYILRRDEMAYLLGHQSPGPDIQWIGDAHDAIIGSFLEMAHGLELKQMRTIHTANLFMMALNSTMSERIITDLFGNLDSAHLFREEAYQEIAELDQEETALLQQGVRSLLEHVVSLWRTAKDRITELSGGRQTALIVPLQLCRDGMLIKELSSILPHVQPKTYSWKEMKKGMITEEVIIALNYKDPGKAPFNFFPSIMEYPLKKDAHFHAVLLRMFFKRRYQHCASQYRSALDHASRSVFRSERLGWRDNQAPPVNAPEREDPMVFEDIDDQEYDLHDPTDMIKVTYTDGDHASFYPSRPLILSDDDKYRVIRADQLTDQHQGAGLQPLDDLYAELNLFKISAEEESELENIKQGFGVTDSKAVLWKILLSARLKEHANDHALYDSVAESLGDPNFIRYQHFRNKWLIAGSDLLIPRKRRHFRSICEYLRLPAAYYRLKLKKRTSLKWRTRQSNQKMNRLLAQLFNDGLFDNETDLRSVKSDHLLNSYDLEEHGITEDNVDTEIRALVELLKENIDLKTIQKIDQS